MKEKSEVRYFKALYFDLRIKNLKEYFSELNPNGAYRKIRDYLVQRDFSHEQYSGYPSKYKTTDLEIFDLIREMGEEFSWLPQCLNHFEVTNIGTDHDLMQLFDDVEPEPDMM